jgi:hypothetical protein
VKANDHTDKVACQTCHIPEFARVNSTKMMWDWSKAGERQDGKPVKKMKDGRPFYDGMKGEFRWEKNVKPEYYWYNGVMRNVLLTDKIDPAGDKLNYPEGNRRIPTNLSFQGSHGKSLTTSSKLWSFRSSSAQKARGPWGDYDWKTAIARA